jgi:FHA domain
MEALLRERRTRPDGFVEYSDTEVSTPAIEIGGAPDQTLQLIGPNIAPRHAQIRVRAGRARIACRRGLTIHVNGQPVRSSDLDQNDVVELDGHRLQLVAPPAGFDLALEITPNAEVQASDFSRAFRTDLAQTWLSKRATAWILFALILFGTLLIPLGQLTWYDGEAKRPFVPADAQWTSGPLFAAHQLAVGSNCNLCHAVPFERVRDSECTTCHDHIADHVEPAVAQRAGLEHVRCATCHQEHNEPPHLVVSSETLCTTCHAHPERFASIRQLSKASGFSSSRHPKFDAYLLRSSHRSGGTGLLFEWHTERVAIEGAKESSNLKFSHSVHLDGSRVLKVTDSTALGCSDCHTLAPDKAHFLPITMEQHCRACHDLKFDPADPARELPHGQPTEAILTIEGHYLRKYGDPNAAPTAEIKRRLPDRPGSLERCTDSAFACAMRKTRDEAVNQFTRRGCITCHVVDDTRSDDIYSRFQVYPIRLVGDYLPRSQFDHASHLTQKDVTGDAACESCHDARHSEDSSDVLIPDLDNCVQCHSSDARERAGNSGVILPCIGCHDYHPRQPMLASSAALQMLEVPDEMRNDPTTPRSAD